VPLYRISAAYSPSQPGEEGLVWVELMIMLLTLAVNVTVAISTLHLNL
jgi:hypothetical protein